MKASQPEMPGRLRVASRNVGSLASKSGEVARELSRRKMDVACLQGTKWKGHGTKKIGERYKLFWPCADKEALNGVGIVVSHDLSDKVLEVRRLTERVMTTKIILESIHVIVSVYAPQTGRPEIGRGTLRAP